MSNLVPYQHADFLSSLIIRSAELTARALGPGGLLPEYRQSICRELQLFKLDTQASFPIDIWQNRELVALHFVDILVEWQAVVIIGNSGQPFSKADRQKMTELLKAAGACVGMLLDFGQDCLTYERVLVSRVR